MKIEDLPNNIENKLWYLKQSHLILEIEVMNAIEDAENWDEAN